MSVVEATQKVESGAVILDSVKARPCAEHRAQIQTLQCIGEEIGSRVAKHSFGDIVIVPQPAAGRVRTGRRNRARSIVAAVDGVGIESQLVTQGLARSSKRQRKILGLTVTSCQSKAEIQSGLPILKETGVQCFLVASLFGIVTKGFHAGFWRLQGAGLGGYLQVVVRSGDWPGDSLAVLQFDL